LKTDLNSKRIQYLAVIVPACGAFALSSLTAGMSEGPLAFAAGFGIGLCATAAVFAAVVALRRSRAA
jgi:hypothetical protein